MLTNLDKPQANRIIIYLALGALLAVGLWLRLRFIHTVQLFPDEFVTLLAVKMIDQTGLPIMPSGLFYDHGLLFSYVGSLAAWLGPLHLSVRYASLVFGLLTIALTFHVGRCWFSPAVGLIAATGLTIAPAAVEWSGRARMYTLLQLLVLLTLWLAFEGIADNKPRWRWAALLAYLGATLAHFVAVTLAPPLVLAAVVFGWLGWAKERGAGSGERGAESGGAGERRSRGAGSGERGAESRKRKAESGERGAQARRRRGAREFVLWFVADARLWLEVGALGGMLVIAFLVKRAGQPKGIEALEANNALAGVAQVLAIYSEISLNFSGGWQAISPFYLTMPALIFALFAVVAVGSAIWSVLSGPAQKIDEMRATYSSLFLGIILLITTLEMIFLVSPDRRDDKYLFMLLPVLFLLGAQGMFVLGQWLIVHCTWPANRRHSLEQHHQRTGQSGNPRAVGVQPLTLSRQSAIRNPQSQILPLLSLVSPLLIAGLILMATRPSIEALLANTGDDYDSAFAYVQSHWQPGDKILTGTPAAAAFYLGWNDFYGVQRRGGYDYRLLNVDGRAVDRWLASPAIRTEAELHQILAGHRVWLVLERWGLQREYYDLPFQQQLLAQTEPAGEAQGIFILRSKPNPRPLVPDPTHRVEAVFGDAVRLEGYTIEPEIPQPGQAVRLTLYWQALAPLAENYTVFIHLRQPNGGNVAQADHRPLENFYPTSLWPVGETIRESTEFPLPAGLQPGTYELWTGLYLLETGQRLSLQDDTSGENAVRLGQLEFSEKP